MAVTLTGTNFVVGATTVAVGGGGVTVTNVVVGSSTSLTASFVLDLAAAAGPRTVTVTTAGGTSGAQTFTINLPAPGSTTFNFTGSPETFTVPAGVVSVTIVATGAQGGTGFGTIGGAGGLGGRTTATVSVTPGASLTVRVGGVGPMVLPVATAGGFNGGGGSAGDGGGGGGASSVRDGATPLVVVGGGGGGGAEPAARLSAAGTAAPAVVSSPILAEPRPQAEAVAGEARRPLAASGASGAASAAPTEPLARRIRVESVAPTSQESLVAAVVAGATSAAAAAAVEIRRRRRRGGGGGSSFTAPGATGVVHDQGVKASNGFVTISW